MGAKGSGGHSRSGPLASKSLQHMGLGASKRSKSKAKRTKIDVPSHLTDEEREVWVRYAPLLESDGRLTDKSAEVLARYCVAVARCRKIADELKTVPSFVVSEVSDRFGNVREIVKAHPLDAMLRQWMATSRSLENDLLLNPASSLRAPSESDDQTDPFDQFEDDDASH